MTPTHWLFAVTIGAVLIQSALACQTDEDCNLNGICTSDICVCDPGWTAANCGALDFLPAKRDFGYNRTAEGISSWGSRIVQDSLDGSLYHAFLAEFTHDCGLDYWSPYSRIIRAESTTGPEGPYRFAAEVVGTFAHNPTVVWSPADAAYLLYYIGCSQTVNASACTGPNFTSGPGNELNGESGISVLKSVDLREWQAYGQVFPGLEYAAWDTDTTNPSPYPLGDCSVSRWPYSEGDQPSASWPESHHAAHPTRPSYRPDPSQLGDGILLAYRGCRYNCNGTELISLALAPTFVGPYTRLNNHEPIFDDPSEDPFIWRDKRGNYHILVHSLEPEGGFGDGPKVGGHAYARTYEGPWTFNNDTLAISTKVEYEDGTLYSGLMIRPCDTVCVALSLSSLSIYLPAVTPR